MNRDVLSECPTKTIVRQEAAYEAAGESGERVVILPIDLSCINSEELIRRGLSPAGLVIQMNQVTVENVGNLYAARARAAASKNESLPTQDDMDALLDSYDFSRIRTTSEAGMSEEERVFRSNLRTQLKRFLKMGLFTPDRTALTVQTVKEATEEKLPEHKISIEDFNGLIESAAEGIEWEFLGHSYDFGGEPKFDDQGQIASFSAIPHAARQLSAQEMELKRQAASLQINASMG